MGLMAGEESMKVVMLVEVCPLEGGEEEGATGDMLVEVLWKGCPVKATLKEEAEEASAAVAVDILMEEEEGVREEGIVTTRRNGNPLHSNMTS